MRHHFEEMVGKTVTGVIVKEGEGRVRSQVFLLFSDGTYFEFYNGFAEIEGTGVIPGGIELIKSYMSDTCHLVGEFHAPAVSPAPSAQAMRFTLKTETGPQGRISWDLVVPMDRQSAAMERILTLINPNGRRDHVAEAIPLAALKNNPDLYALIKAKLASIQFKGFLP